MLAKPEDEEKRSIRTAITYLQPAKRVEPAEVTPKRNASAMYSMINRLMACCEQEGIERRNFTPHEQYKIKIGNT